MKCPSRSETDETNNFPTKSSCRNEKTICLFIMFCAIFALALTSSYCLLKVSELEKFVTKQDEQILKLVSLYDDVQKLVIHTENRRSKFDNYNDDMAGTDNDNAEDLKGHQEKILSASSDLVRKRRNIGGVDIADQSKYKSTTFTPSSVDAKTESNRLNASWKSFLTTTNFQQASPTLIPGDHSQSRKPRIIQLIKSNDGKFGDSNQQRKQIIQDSQSDESGIKQNYRSNSGYNQGTFGRAKQRFVENMNESPMVMQMSDRRHIQAAHFIGDTSKYILGHHANYKGNGHLKHPEKKYVDWVPSEWMKVAGMNYSFQLENGIMTVRESGLYFIYAQIYYLDEHDMNGYRVYRNKEAILQCTIMTHSTARIIKGNTCFTAGIEYLSKGDSICVRDLSDERYSLFEKSKSFFGAMKLSDIRIR